MKVKKTNNPLPIKRHKAIQPLSRQHHHSLLFCWKIRTGFRKNIAAERMWLYAGWFYKQHLLPHFKEEEEKIFIIPGINNPLVKKALADHRRLIRLFENNTNIEKSLSLIEEELEAHIRFEERVLFNEIQTLATPKQLEELNIIENSAEDTSSWPDEFWEEQTP